jgi:hypothetical protein
MPMFANVIVDVDVGFSRSAADGKRSSSTDVERTRKYNNDNEQM